MDKVEREFLELVSAGDDQHLAGYAKSVIPLLLQDARKTRLEVVNGILKTGEV